MFAILWDSSSMVISCFVISFKQGPRASSSTSLPFLLTGKWQICYNNRTVFRPLYLSYRAMNIILFFSMCWNIVICDLLHGLFIPCTLDWHRDWFFSVCRYSFMWNLIKNLEISTPLYHGPGLLFRPAWEALTMARSRHKVLKTGTINYINTISEAKATLVEFVLV